MSSAGESTTTKKKKTSTKVERSPTASRKSRRRRWLFRLVVLLMIVIGQEPLFRVLFPTPEIVGFNRINYQQMAQSHPQFGRIMQRGLVYDRLLLESRPDGFAYTHDLNMYGFRGPDFRADPAPGRRRIIVVGDSVVEGQGADGSHTLTAEWSRLLANEGVDAEVINLGVISASLPHLWLITRDAVRLFKPSDVVISLYPNDLPAPFIPETFTARPPYYPRAPTAPYAPRIVDLIDRLIYEKPIYRRWFHLPMRVFLPAPDGSNPWSGDRPRPPELREDLYEEMKTARFNPWLYAQAREVAGQLSHDFSNGGSPWPYLEAMDRACRAAGARLLVAYNPFCGVVHPRYAASLIATGMERETAEALAVDPKYRSQNRQMAEVCAAMNLPLADSTEALKAAEAATPQFWAYDTHPNADGYATIARNLHETWKAANASPTRPSPTLGASP